MISNPTCDIHRTDKKGANCFWLACENGKHEILPTLVEKEINYLIITKDGRNALHAAAFNNHPKVVDYIIQMKTFPLNVRVNKGTTAVAIAAEQGHFEIVKLLVEAGVNINKLSSDGVGPLYRAIDNNHTEVAHYLVEKGAKMVMSTKYRDKSPLFLVINNQDIKMLKFL